ncbi:cytochrome c2 [Chitinophaga sp. W3I9]
MKLLIVLFGLTMAIDFSCKSVKESKSGKKLVTENCISCHNYSETRSMYTPSILV